MPGDRIGKKDNLPPTTLVPWSPTTTGSEGKRRSCHHCIVCNTIYRKILWRGLLTPLDTRIGTSTKFVWMHVIKTISDKFRRSSRSSQKLRNNPNSASTTGWLFFIFTESNKAKLDHGKRVGNAVPIRPISLEAVWTIRPSTLLRGGA